MNIKINNTEVQYTSEFRMKYPDIFKILSDIQHEVYYIDNDEYEDIIVFVSYKQKTFSTILMSDFESELKKLNKKIFYNIIGLFNEVFEGVISKVDIVTKSELNNLLSFNLELKKINFIKKKDVMYLYFSPEDEVGDIIDIDTIKNRKIFLEKLSMFNIDKLENMIYNPIDDTLLFINIKSGYITILPLKEYPDIKEIMPVTEKILMKYDNILLCDIRKSFKYFPQNSMCKELNYIVNENTLYITYIKDFFKYQTLAECSKNAYNNRNESLYLELKSQLKAKNMFYIINQNMSDFILYTNNLDETTFVLTKDLKIDKNCCEIMECFEITDIISLSDLGEQAILSVGYMDYDDFDDKYQHFDNGCYVFWVDYFEKKLRYSKKYN